MNPNHLVAKLMLGEEANYMPPIGSAYNFWIGQSNNLWNTSGNWSKNTPPSSGDIVIFNKIGSGQPCTTNSVVIANHLHSLLMYPDYTGTFSNITTIVLSTVNTTYFASPNINLNASFYVTSKKDTYFNNKSKINFGPNGFFVMEGNVYSDSSGLSYPIVSAYITGNNTKVVNLTNIDIRTLDINNYGHGYTTLSGNILARDIYIGTGIQPTNNAASGLVNINGATIVVQSGLHIAGYNGINFVPSGWNNSNITVSGTLNLLGTSNNVLNLEASNNWTLNALGTNNVSYVKVSHSNASSGNTIYAYNSINSAYNTNWWFYTFDDSENTIPIMVCNNMGGIIGESENDTVGGLPIFDFGDYGNGGFGTDTNNKGKISLYIRGLTPSITGDVPATVFGGGSYSANSSIPMTVLGGYVGTIGGDSLDSLNISVINDSQLIDSLGMMIIGEGVTPNFIPISGDYLMPLTVYNTVEGQDLPFFISGSDTITQDVYLTVKGEPQATGIMYMSIPGVSEDSNRQMAIYVRGF